MNMMDLIHVAVGSGGCLRRIVAVLTRAQVGARTSDSAPASVGKCQIYRACCQNGFLSCRALSPATAGLLLVIFKMRDSSTSLGMTEGVLSHLKWCRAFGQ